MTKEVDAAGRSICGVYDPLHRPTDLIPSVGNCNRFRYDNTNGVLGTIPIGVTVANKLGHLVEAETDTCASPITSASITTDEWFSYTARGQEVSDKYQFSAHTANIYHQNITYWASGRIHQTSGLSLPTFTYGLDGEGRVNSISASTGQTPLTNTTYNPASLPGTVTLGSGDTDVYTHDANTERIIKYQFNVNGQAYSGTPTWHANGSLASLVIVDPFNAADAQTCFYTHDDLARVASVGCGASTWQQIFAYDAFGNLTKTVPTGGTGSSFQPTYSSATNRITNNSGFTPSYDAAGDVLNDGINSFSWDAFGSRTMANGTSAINDAFGQLIQIGTTQEVFYGLDGSQTQIISGVVRLAKIRLPGGGFAAYDVSSGGLNSYHHADNLGSIRLFSTPTRTTFVRFTAKVRKPNLPRWQGEHQCLSESRGTGFTNTPEFLFLFMRAKWLNLPYKQSSLEAIAGSLKFR